MVRYTLLLMALSVATMGAQTTDWIGTMEVHDSRGLSIGRITATLTTTPTTLSGDWRSKSGASGSMTGTINDKGRIKATFTAFGGARFDDGRAVPERCHGSAQAAGQLHTSGVVRLTIDRIRLDTPQQRARERACEDLTDVVVLLQPAH